MEISIEEELLKRMNESTYVFTRLCHRSIEKTKDGVFGFQITQGLWFKLRIFLLKREGDDKKFDIVFVDKFFGQQKARDKMHELQQKYLKNEQQ
ncbi:unnamed protein product (macronuclear) [Paramecium tetraurelia]|uniref:Uncharacterized protein n=1 Tax=Paramecium tetraurelia TaxID=5888 RepID=A0EAA2_PARTE|nr:uncharacterized protein GSPATT00024951001 [Paramecium tetraurelia]CAK92219.1 unnamed protein product [Paramecium tetraurelia]|eukprot:XP_001459616.1 hypothetical protein (macronuclear) [Paramecium tetraurelia strain d4-2]